MSTPQRRPAGSDGPPRPRRDPATRSVDRDVEREDDAARDAGPEAADPSRRGPEAAGDRAHGLDVARDRDVEAVDAATSERLSGGVRRDLHGEYTPDPFPDDRDPGETTEDVIEHHRRQADRIEHQPDVPRADE